MVLETGPPADGDRHVRSLRGEPRSRACLLRRSGSTRHGRSHELSYQLQLHRSVDATHRPEQGAAEGAPFISRHMIRKAERVFDDFAGTGADKALLEDVLGLNSD